MRTLITKVFQSKDHARSVLVVTFSGVLAVILLLVAITSFDSTLVSKTESSLSTTSNGSTTLSTTTTSSATTTSSTTPPTTTNPGTTSSVVNSTTTSEPITTTTTPHVPTWHNIVPTTGVSEFSNSSLHDLSCPTVTFCVALSHSTINTQNYSSLLVSYDFGESWSATTFNNTGLNSVSCLSSSTCIVVGGVSFDTAIELKTSDSGKTWQQVPLPPTSQYATYIYCIFGSQTCYTANGGYGNPKGYKAKSSDGGLTWVTMDLPSASNILVTGISCLNTLDCAIVGYAFITFGGPTNTADIEPYDFYTVDGGQSWQQVENMGTTVATDALGCPASGNSCFAIVQKPVNNTSASIGGNLVMDELQFSSTGATFITMPESPYANSGLLYPNGEFISCNAGNCIFPAYPNIDSVSFSGQPTFATQTTEVRGSDSMVSACVQNGPQCLILGAADSGTPQNVEEAFS